MFDDHQQQGQIGAGLAPVDPAHYLHRDFANFSGGETTDLGHRQGVVI
jgi:hypothetical protein